VDGLARGGEREARRAVPRHAAGAVRQRGADVAAGGDAVGALPARPHCGRNTGTTVSPTVTSCT
jgi:hypothetical protein